MSLVNISESNSVSNYKSPFGCRFLLHNHSEKSGLSGAIRANNTNDSIWRQAEFKIFKKQFVIKGFCNRPGFYYFIAEPWSVWNKYFKLIFFLFYILIQK